MLDFATYRHFEELAKAASPSWRLPQRHNVVFLYNLNLLSQLRMYMDAMQEFRYDAFMNELGGFDAKDRDLFLDICQDVVDFQNTYFQGHPIILPYSSLLSAFCIYKKVAALKPNFESILEIGPGSGLFTFVLKRARPELKNYTQIEACESFYVLQHYINIFLYGKNFDQKIFPNPSSCFNLYSGELIGKSAKTEFRFDSLILPAAQPEKTVHQYPWWNIGEVYDSSISYDIILSNANLFELFGPALDDYLSLMKRKMAKNAILYAQCFGGGPFGNNHEPFFKHLHSEGFAPLFLSFSSQSKGDAQWIQGDNYLNIDRNDARHFALRNGVFVTEKHELFQQAHNIQNYKDFFFARHEAIKQAFFPPCENRRKYSPTELTNLLQGREALQGVSTSMVKGQYAHASC